ncbi:MAG: hypothetical protein DI585_06620 [Pseudomonas fluorescens]|nr:MAG: hypothetical protein DI585_06620 [Pseudomonas fluorescens]
MKKQNATAISAAPQSGDVSEIKAISMALINPLALIVTGLATIWAGYHVENIPAPTLAYALFAFYLSLLAVIDARHKILPHTLTWSLAVLGVAFAPTLGLTYTESLTGAAVAFGGLFLCGWIAQILTGKESLGGGDLWLVLALGAWVGVGGLPMLLMATAVTGILSVCIRRYVTQNMPNYYQPENAQFPFGPALCAAGWLALLYKSAYWDTIEMLIGTAS